MKDLSPLWYWINERHKIYLRREEGKPWPWTEDPILQEYRFCNVFRELDKVTIWIRKNWREPYANHPNLWFAMCIARQINRIETLQKLGFPISGRRSYVDHCRQVLSHMRENKEQIYGSAYILTAGGKTGPKYLYTVNQVFQPLAEKPPSFVKQGGGTLKRMSGCLCQYLGFGPFVAYEVVSDLRWTNWYIGSDHMTWANPGPGAKRGLSRLWYGDKKAQIPRKKQLEMMQQLLEMSRQHTDSHVPDLEMRDIEHSLCETDKYLRAKTGEGRPKAKYRANPR